MATLRAPATNTPRQFSNEYIKLFNELLVKLNEGLYTDKSLNVAVAKYNAVVTQGGIAQPNEIQEAYNDVISKMIDTTQSKDAPAMVKRVFPQLESYNRSKWRKSMTAQAGDTMAVRIDRRTRAAASKELSKRMGENVDRITAWSQEHYQDFQNNMNNAIRRAENTGAAINLREIASREILEGNVPPNKRIKNRAKLIARDQTAKFNSALTRTRARELGGDYYQWVDAGDSRVRSQHEVYSGRYFNLAGKEVDSKGELIKGGVDTHGVQPGDEVNCRCIAKWMITL